MKIKPAITGWRPSEVAAPNQQRGVPRLQCEAVIPLPDMSYQHNWRKNRYTKRGTDPQCCQRLALYEIDGKRYCAVHAGKVALRYLWEQSNGNN